jgi:hypothetical protein
VSEEGSLALCHEGILEEGYEGIQVEFSHYCEKRSKIGGIISWLYILLLNIYLSISESILCMIEVHWKLAKENIMHVLQLCKYGRDDRESVAQSISANSMKVVRNQRLESNQEYDKEEMLLYQAARKNKILTYKDNYEGDYENFPQRRTKWDNALKSTMTVLFLVLRR